MSSKRQEPKYKINRRLGVNLWGRPKSPLNRREYGPGQHGQRRKKPSDFGTQLAAKQKLKGYYANLGERQFRRLYEEAVRRRGDTGDNLIELLERRLDAVVYRMKLVPTPFAARQLVNHGHVRVNGRRVTSRPTRCATATTIELAAKAKAMALVLEAAQVGRARRSRLRRNRPRPHEGPLYPRAQAGRRAVSGDDGAEPRRRISIRAEPAGCRRWSSPRVDRRGTAAGGKPRLGAAFLWRAIPSDPVAGGEAGGSRRDPSGRWRC